jgi:hypothetical protein
VNAQVEDHPLDDPLEVGQVYVLAFDVDVERRPDAVTTGFSEAGLFSPDTDEVELTIQLGGADFEIGDKVRPLRVPREGKSRGKARFDVTPKRAGRVMLVATIHKQGNFVQQVELVYFAVPRGRREADAPRPSVTSVGRPVTAAQMLQPRDISIHIRPTANGYECTMTEGVVMDVSMPVTVPELGAAIDAARAALMSVVERRGPDGRYVFQSGIDIPPSENQWALQVLARAGALLFNRIFHHHAGGTELSEAGNWLRDRANEPDSRLKIQIVAKSFPVPWGLLYVGDVRTGATLDWEKFLGFRHVIDQLPRAKLKSVGRVIASRPHLAISVNINEGIDVEMKSPLVKDQRTYWSSAAQQHKRLRLTSRTTRAEVLQALGGMPEDDQIAYFYCHADSAALGAVSGPGGSYLVMSNKERITLDDLVVEAPKSVQLAGNPLVFINACESAQLSPVFYDGFVPYFMAKGARGVVGTECNMPALFAAEWARRFFERFLHGESIGDAFFALRREFLEQHRNPLGLLYAVYCDGDTCVSPALSA